MMLANINPHSVMIAGGVLLIGWIALQAFGRYAGRKMFADFEKRFPGECPLCSFHRYGLQNGYVSGPVERHPRCKNAAPQNCPECESPCFFTVEGEWIGCNCADAQRLPYGGVE